jgi:hypothetical protein
MLTGIADALSNDQDVHLSGIDARAAILDGKLVQRSSKSCRKRAS